MRRRTVSIALFAVAAALSLVLGFGSTPIAQSRNRPVSNPPSASPGFKFTPVADAYVSSSKPSTNYGSGTRLKAEEAPVMKAYLRFAGGNISGQVTRATLWLYAVTGSNMGYGVHTVSDSSWQESGITFANAPSISATPIGSTKGYVSGTWTAVDVTSAVSATGSASFAVTTPSTNALAIGSRESGNKSPVLVVETTSPDATPPSTPTGLLVTATTGSSVSLSWSASTDDVGVAGYGIYRDGTLVGSTSQTSYTLGGLSCGTTYTVGVDAYDAAGNRSSPTPLVVATSACPDTAAPTAPTGLTVTSASATQISLSWSPSTDNVGVAGYNMFLNGTLIDSTGATDYSFTGLLLCGTSYTVGVQAYDAAGNLSGQSSIVAATSPCLDTLAPTAPTGLAATADSTNISALWNPSFDNVGVSGYDVFLNGSKVGSTALTNYTFAGLTCGTSYTVGVDAYDAAGNLSARATVAAATSACTSPPPQTAPQYRYIYNSGSDPAIAQNGWNLYDVSSKTTADALPAGTSALYWLGDYDNSSCSWQVSDSTVTTTVQRMVGDAKIFGYFISDEPNPYACPGAPAQHKARSDLIHSIDSSKQVVVVLDSNGFSGLATRDALDQLPLWKGTADVIGLDPYPCYQGGACDYTWIDRTIAAADNAGLNYWGVAQAFNDSSWRWPTADEESHMLSQWAASKQSGYMTFAWTWAGNNLTSQPALLDVFKQFNNGSSSGGSSSGSGSGGGSADTTAPSTPTGLSKVSSNATSVSLSWNASTDNVGVSGYGVYRNGALVSSTSGTSYTVGGLACGTSYTFSIDAYDAAGNRSAKASITAATNTCTDTAAPSAPTNLNATGATTTSVSFSWTASTDNVGVAGYGVYRGGTLVASPTATNYTLSGLTCGTSYSIGVDAFDAVGNRSQPSSLTIATSPCADSIAPTAPGTPTATSATTTSIALSWGPSLDNIGVVGYDLYRNTTKVGSTSGTNYTFGSLTCGTSYTLGVEAYDAAGNHSTRSSLSASTSACSTSDPVVAAAGDSCWTDTTTCSGTATLLEQINPDAVLTLGDNQYPDGALSDYNSYYKPQWGRLDSKVFPSPGNHEFHIANAQGYRDYFGARAPALYYSYDLGAWHIVSLAGDVGISASAGSAQETWLKQDLAAHPSKCILAYWHEPRFSSGTEHGSDIGVSAFWNDLYAAGADVVLNGHEHNYERFAEQNPTGQADPNGIREIVSGTGGVLGGYTFGTPVANSEVRNSTTAGVLKLTLHPESYDWQFVPVAGATFTDSGSAGC